MRRKEGQKTAHLKLRGTSTPKTGPRNGKETGWREGAAVAREMKSDGRGRGLEPAVSCVHAEHVP